MRSIFITGATSGIGLACAKASAELNYKVYATYRKTSDEEKLLKVHKNIEPIKLDVLDYKNIDEVISTFIQKDIVIDHLFNNAGSAASGAVEFLAIDLFKSQMEVNFFSSVYLTQKFLPILRKSSDPRILFTGSASGVLAKPLMGPYSASKFALEAFVDTLRLELSPWNFKIVLFEPGKIKTEIYHKALAEEKIKREKMNQVEISLYKDLYDVAMYNIVHADTMSSDVSVLVKVFIEALESKNPKTRYAVGGDAKFQSILAKYFPDSIKDFVIRKKISNLKKNI